MWVRQVEGPTWNADERAEILDPLKWCAQNEQNIFSEHTGQRASLVRCTVTLASLCSPAIFPPRSQASHSSYSHLASIWRLYCPPLSIPILSVSFWQTLRERCAAQEAPENKGLHLDFIAAQFSPLVCATDWMWRAGPANTESAWMSTVDRYWYWSADWDCCWGSAATWCEARREHDANTPNTGRGD